MKFYYFLQELDYKTKVEAKGTFNIQEIPVNKRNTLVQTGTAKLNIPIGSRLYEFECESNAVAQQWQAAILTHFKK